MNSMKSVVFNAGSIQIKYSIDLNNLSLDNIIVDIKSKLDSCKSEYMIVNNDKEVLDSDELRDLILNKGVESFEFVNKNTSNIDLNNYSIEESIFTVNNIDSNEINNKLNTYDVQVVDKEYKKDNKQKDLEQLFKTLEDNPQFSRYLNHIAKNYNYLNKSCLNNNNTIDLNKLFIIKAYLSTGVSKAIIVKPNNELSIEVIVQNNGSIPITKFCSTCDVLGSNYVLENLNYRKKSNYKDDIILLPNEGYSCNVVISLKDITIEEKFTVSIGIELEDKSLNFESNKIEIQCYIKVDNPLLEFVRSKTNNKDILNLPKENLSILYNIINQGIVENNIESIYKAMVKHKWNADNAVDELLN